jgi:hypothetical protein
MLRVADTRPPRSRQRKSSWIGDGIRIALVVALATSALFGARQLATSASDRDHDPGARLAAVDGRDQPTTYGRGTTATGPGAAPEGAPGTAGANPGAAASDRPANGSASATWPPPAPTPPLFGPAAPVRVPPTPVPPARPPASAPGWRVFTPPASIDTTGTRDVTDELQAFLRTVPHHAVISFPRGATYRIEGTLRVASRNDLYVDGNGATFIATSIARPGDNPRLRSQWDFRDVSNLTVEDMVIKGANPRAGIDEPAYVEAYEAQHGINVLGGERIDIHDVTISDVYGDFIYVGGSPFRVFGIPTNVWIHDNTLRRNGRQGISVTTGFNVVIEHNDISDTRRSTIDFEPGTPSGSVRNVWVRDNQVGPGRLLFVAGHGEGNVSDIYIQNNRLSGHNLGIDMASPDYLRRQNVVITGNVSNEGVGNGRGAIIRTVGYDYVDVRNNVNPAQKARNMFMLGTMSSCKVTAAGNDLGRYGAGQQKVLAADYDCSKVGPLVLPVAPAVWSGDSMTIDVGGSAPGTVPCPTTSTCNGWYAGGPAVPLVAEAATGARGPDQPYRTMLEGDLHFSIPIRAGTYTVTLSFVETQEANLRSFQLDLERERVESGFEVKRRAHGINRVYTKSYTVTTGDGALSIDTKSGGTEPFDPIMGLIRIDRQ